MRFSRVELCTGAIVACLYLGMLAAILLRNDGTLSYSLDDPYIHLAMAENIVHGHYGINLSEPSAPSSSILFPFLLALFVPLGLDAWAPALLNFIATAGSFLVIQRLLARSGLGSDRLGALVSVVLVLCVGLSFNVLGVAFTGMEHSLHIAVTLLTLYGVVVAIESGQARWWLWVSLLLGPLLRFEGLAVSLPVCAGLFFVGYRRQSSGCILALVALMGGFSGFLASQGLPLLPSSVLSKSAVAVSTVDPESIFSFARVFVDHALIAMGKRPGLLLLVLASVSLVRVFAAGVASFSRKGLIPCLAVAVAGLHLVAGNYDWFQRYELYAVLFAFLAAVYTWRDELAHLPRSSFPAIVVAFFSLFAINFPYAQATALTPLAARNIYEQQYQMHRFATEFYEGPVAVNDLGWVAYRNPKYVLDLAGLGSERARNSRRTATDAAWMDALTTEYGVGVAVVYKDVWRHGLPEPWTELARLHLGTPRITPAESVVAFYSTRASHDREILGSLECLAQQLPEGVRLEFLVDRVVLDSSDSCAPDTER